MRVRDEPAWPLRFQIPPAPGGSSLCAGGILGGPMSKHYEGVIERTGPRGTTYSIRYFDASGQRQFETLGKAPEWSAAKASKERQRRIVAVENQGFQKPNGKITFGVFAEEWMESYGESRGLKLSAAASYK